LELHIRVWSESLADKYYNELLNACKIVADNQDLEKLWEISAAIFGYKSVNIFCLRKKKMKTIEIIRFLHSDEFEKRIQD
jgi:toxin ParE1/3/4